nr:hypothetical protein [uncultured Blautia sp.]
MKRKVAMALFLFATTLIGCGNTAPMPKLPTKEEKGIMQSELNEALSNIGGACDSVSFNGTNESDYTFNILITPDNGNNFGQKCKIISEYVSTFSDGKFKDYDLSIKELHDEENLVSWDSATKVYFNSLNGKENLLAVEDVTLDELIAMDDGPISSNQNSKQNYKEAGELDKEYISLFKKYSEIFSEELKVFDTSEQLMQAISENKNTDDIFTILESAMALATESEEKLNGYFMEFDANRQEAPYGTKIMTLLAHAQSAVTQYNIALSHLNEFLLSSDQNDVSDFQKYTEKARQSLNDYNSVLNEELSKIN